MKHSMFIGDQEIFVHYDYEITDAGAPVVGASFNDPGDPGWPMEYTISITALEYSRGEGWITTTEIPQWLNDLLSLELMDSPVIYDEIEAEEREITSTKLEYHREP